MCTSSLPTHQPPSLQVGNIYLNSLRAPCIRWFRTGIWCVLLTWGWKQVRCVTWVIRPPNGHLTAWAMCAYILCTPTHTSWRHRRTFWQDLIWNFNITHNLKKYLVVQLRSLVGVKICVGIKSCFQTIQKGGLCLWEFSFNRWMGKATSLMQTHQLVQANDSSTTAGFPFWVSCSSGGRLQNLRVRPGEHWPMSD